MENDNKSLTEQEAVRREKLQFLEDMGVDPFGHAFKRTDSSKTLRDKYSDKTKEELEELAPHTVIAGRIMTKRRQGKIMFLDLQDRYGRIQVYVKKDDIGEENYEIAKKSDIGDIIGIEGRAFITMTGELTVHTEVYTHLSKALKPLPDKWSGLQDVEEARRKRYVDLIVNEDSKRIAITRPKIIRSIQHYLDSLDFIEVETPVLQPILGGASARPFVTHHNTLDMPFYLRIATELPLKKLIVGGLEKVYEIGRLFRNEGMDAKHNPEFTSVEIYEAYSNLDGMMDLAEGLFRTVCQDVLGTTTVTFQGKEFDLGKPFKRVSMVDAIKEKTGVDFNKEMTFEEAVAIAKEHNLKVEPHFTGVGHIINLFFESYVEETLIEPTFLYRYPIEISPLTKRNKENPNFTDRFELFINGCEYGNAYTELNDPIDQLKRFEDQLKERELGNDEACEIDTDFVEALEYGMPPCGGIGIGIDRLVMFITDTANIRDIILFPHMRRQ